MASRGRLVLPTTAALEGSHRLSSTNPFVSRLLSKLSRTTLLSLAEEWMEESNEPTCAPILRPFDEEELPVYATAQSVEELREIYTDFQLRKGGKREVIDRVLECDWRNGLSLHQLAMADIAHLNEHPSSQRWAALQLKRSLPESDKGSSKSRVESTTTEELPRFHGSTFVKQLQSEVGSLVKAHYYLTHMQTLPITLVRIHIVESPYSTQSKSSQGKEPSTTMYLAFPDHSSFVYVSLNSSSGSSKGADATSIRKHILEAIPKAFSKPRQRYELKPTTLMAKSLPALLALRGSKSNAAAGAFTIYQDGTAENGPLTDIAASKSLLGEGDNKENVQSNGEATSKKRKLDDTMTEEDRYKKRRILIAQSRFGNSALTGDDKGIERFEVRVEDAFPVCQSSSSSSIFITDDQNSDDESMHHSYSKTKFCPVVRLTFQGPHVFAGIRKLVESGAIDGEKMPGWMTGESGVSVGVVKNGRIKGNRGGGFY
jgi:central kinetochore subunit Mis15/CHL4